MRCISSKHFVLLLNLISNGSFQHNSHGVRLTVTIAVEQSYKLGSARPVSQCHAQQQMFWYFPSFSSHCHTNIFGNGLWKSWRLNAWGERKISDRKSNKELGGEITPELKNLLMTAMVSPENAAWMWRQSIEVASSKIIFSEVAASNAASTASPVSRAKECTISLF